MSWWNKYIGVPFAEKGRSMDGADCWGLVKMIYEQELGIELPSYLECYETTNDRDILAEKISSERSEKWSNPATSKTHDVIILRMRGVPMHVGVVTKPGYMVHCAKGVGTAHERFDSMKWRTNVMGFARYDKN